MLKTRTDLVLPDQAEARQESLSAIGITETAHAPLAFEPDLPALGNLYEKIGRMRVQSSRAVADEADVIGRKIVDTYLGPGKTFIEIRETLADGSIDILGKFGDVCRLEFESLRAQLF